MKKIKKILRTCMDNDVLMYLASPLMGGVLALFWHRLSHHFYSLSEVLMTFATGFFVVLVANLFVYVLKELFTR